MEAQTVPSLPVTPFPLSDIDEIATSSVQNTPLDDRTFALNEMTRAGLSLAKKGQLDAITRCESGWHQFDTDGKLLHGKVHYADVGYAQINLDAHPNITGTMGYDVTTLKGNVDYGIYLFLTEGGIPWFPSMNCWNK